MGFPTEGASGKFSAWDIYVRGSVEVKRDRRAPATGNFFVEQSAYDKPSGIAITKATAWALIAERTAYLIGTEKIKVLLDSLAPAPGPDGKSGLILPVRTLRALPHVEVDSMNAARTWPNVEEMRRGIGLLLQGNTYFARQYTFTNSEGKEKQAYRPCYDLNQLTRFEADIFDGKQTVGFYSIRPDNRTRWGALDFDNHDGGKSRGYWLPRAQAAFDSLAKRFPEVWLVESSPGGYHVIAFAAELLPAADMLRALREIEPDESIEAFPKLDKHKSTSKHMGYLLRQPGYHQQRRVWARFIARSGHVQDLDGITSSETGPVRTAERQSKISQPLRASHPWHSHHRHRPTIQRHAAHRWPAQRAYPRRNDCGGRSRQILESAPRPDSDTD